MLCPKCQAEVSEAKFCSDCGARMPVPTAEHSADVVQLAEKAVVAGDVTGGDKIEVRTHGGDSHIHLHRSNEEAAKEAEQQYLKDFEAVYADGNVTRQEREHLKRLAVKIGISEDRERELFNNLRDQEDGGRLGALSNETLRKAQALLEDSKTKEALMELAPLYAEHGHTHEAVREAYLRALLTEDRDKLLTETQRILDDEGIDNAAAYLYRAEAMIMEGNLVGAEKLNQKAQSAFLGDIRFKAQEAKLMLTTYQKNGEEGYLSGAGEVLDGLGGKAKNSGDAYAYSVIALRNHLLNQIEKDKRRQEAEAKRKIEEEKQRIKAEREKQRKAEAKRVAEKAEQSRKHKERQKKAQKEKQLRKSENQEKIEEGEQIRKSYQKEVYSEYPNLLRKRKKLAIGVPIITFFLSIVVVCAIFLSHYGRPATLSIGIGLGIFAFAGVHAALYRWVLSPDQRNAYNLYEEKETHTITIIVAPIGGLSFLCWSWGLTEALEWGTWFLWVRIILLPIFMFIVTLFCAETKNYVGVKLTIFMVIIATLVAIFINPLPS